MKNTGRFAGPHDTEITLDIYPYGAWVKSRANRPRSTTPRRSPASEKDYIDAGADDLYLAWIKNITSPRCGMCGLVSAAKVT